MSKLSHNIRLISFYTVLASAFQMLESYIPTPVPGLKLGLANMITLFVLLNYSSRAALEVAIYRTLLSSILTGSLLSPGFILSFSGAVISTLSMACLLAWSKRFYNLRFSIIGISVFGAVMHNSTQLLLAYFVLIKNTGIFSFFPWLLWGGLWVGWFNGLLCISLSRKMQTLSLEALESNFHESASPLHPGQYAESAPRGRLEPYKIFFVLSLALISFFLDNGYGLVLFISVIMALLSLHQIPFSQVFFALRRITFLVLFAIMLPLLFNTGGNIIYQFSFFQITREGLHSGFMYAGRIILLVLSSLFVAKTIPGERIFFYLFRLLKPLSLIGVSNTRIAHIISYSWFLMPHMWEQVSTRFKLKDLKRVRSIHELIDILSDFLVELYLNPPAKTPVP